MTENIPKGPFFLGPLKTETSGVDFLGMRQVNLDMMDTCLPGINNYTRYVRGFSVIAWIYWKFYNLAAEMGIEAPSASQLRIFKDKAEILFTWGHQGLNLSSIPGISTAPPATGGQVELSFSAWKRNADNTSLMAAPTYGPASKNTGGLGFIAPVFGAFYKVCGNGVKLAEALDAQLIKQGSYDLLTSMNAASGDEANAKDLLPAWDLRCPSSDERKAFLSSFYDPKAIGKESKMGQRSSTLCLIMQVLETSGTPLTESQLRMTMAYGKRPKHDYLPLSDSLEVARANWLILQVRQAHRFAMESIFSWTELRITQYKEVQTRSMVKSALAAIRAASDVIPSGDNPGQMIDLLFGDINTLTDLIDNADNYPMYCIFNLVDQLQNKLETDQAMVIPYALRLLLLCAKFADLLKETGAATRLLNHGRAERISLLYWHYTLMKWRDRPTEELLYYLLENFILSQHFGVAASRFDGNRQRLRIAIEEEGLVSLVPKPLEPAIGADRLSMALLLMADCGLIAASEEAKYSAINGPLGAIVAA